MFLQIFAVLSTWTMPIEMLTIVHTFVKLMCMSVNWLFVDMNSYFASVEQHDDPELRGRPVAIAPVMADNTSCLAASYEAKRFGIKTGTKLWEARQLCPEIRIVLARVKRYVQVHHQIVAAVHSIVPVDKTHSIDEMSCRLTTYQREINVATRLGHEIKAAIATQVGPFLKCSIGIAPNRYLAKVATDLQKPDGFTLLTLDDLPHRLIGLKLRDFPGIGARMELRLQRAGIFTVQQMYNCSESQLERVWGGIEGRRWFWKIRGHHIAEPDTHRGSFGQSHVLPPDLRHDLGCKGILIKLIAKAARRLRMDNFWAKSLSIKVNGLAGPRWEKTVHLPPTQETSTFLEVFARMWEDRDQDTTANPIKVSMVLSDVSNQKSTPASLLPQDRKRNEAARLMDQINERFGRDMLYPAAMHETRHAAPARIAFNTIPDAREFDGSPKNFFTTQ
jgi:DNA polymerase-4